MKLNNVLFLIIATLLMALPASYEPHHFAKTLFMGALLQSFTISTFMLCLVRKSIVWKRVILTVLYLLFCLETYVYIQFQSRFDPNMLTLILQTNTREASEFFSVFILSLPTLILFVIMAIGLYAILKSMRLSRNIAFFKKKIVLAAVALLSLSGLAITFFPLPFPLGNNTLSELYTSFQFVRDSHQDISKMEATIDKIKITAYPPDDAPVIVLVIGESYNKHHSSLYGYPLLTSPLLMKEQEDSLLICFSNAVSPTNSTSEAMRYIFTLKGCENESTDDERPFVLMPAVFRKAHYNVLYFDNQYTRSTGGSLDFSCGYFLNPSYINTSCFDFRNTELKSFDDDFITYYQSKFRTKPRSLNIIHLMGQHFDAANRFPDSFTHFTQNDIKRTDLSASQRQQVADYDNATLYNDLVLKHIFDYFRKVNAIVVYLSDHGEQIYDGSHHYYGRTFGSYQEEETIKAVYEVPFMIWCSPLYRQLNSDTYQQLQQSKERPLCTADLCYLLFELAGIEFNYHVPSRSVINDSYTPHRVNH